MDALRVHLGFAKILGTVCLIAIVITILIYYIFRKEEKYRLIKYIPGLILILIGLFNLFNLGIELPGINEFNKVLIMVTSMVGGFISLSTGLIIGIINKGRR